MAYNTEVVADSPIWYYHLDEVSGTTMSDSSGNARHGIYQTTASLGYNQASLLPLYANASMRFNNPGNSGNGRRTYGADGDPAGNSITLECWIKANNGATPGTDKLALNNYGAIFQRSLDYCLEGYNDNDQLRLRARVRKQGDASGTYKTIGNVSALNLSWGVSYHVALVLNGNNAYWYINGALAYTESWDGPFVKGTGNNWFFGKDIDSGATANNWRGWLDEIALYHTALSAGRVAAHYGAGSNTAPTASFTVTPDPANIHQTITLDGSGSSDPEGAIAKYEWDLDGNGSYEVDGGVTATRTTSFSTTGVKTIGLRVTDSNAVTATTTRTVTVTNTEPSVEILPPEDVIYIGDQITFTLDISDSAFDTVEWYLWELGLDGDVIQTGDTDSLVVDVDSHGFYEMTVNVSDGDLTGFDTYSFTVDPIPAPRHRAGAASRVAKFSPRVARLFKAPRPPRPKSR